MGLHGARVRAGFNQLLLPQADHRGFPQHLLPRARDLRFQLLDRDFLVLIVDVKALPSLHHRVHFPVNSVLFYAVTLPY